MPLFLLRLLLQRRQRRRPCWRHNRQEPLPTCCCADVCAKRLCRRPRPRAHTAALEHAAPASFGAAASTAAGAAAGTQHACPQR